MTEHYCGHRCCDERSDPLHDHFLDPDVCPTCAARCIDCHAPVRPTPPEFRDPPEDPNPPEVSKVEWWTGRPLYCQACFDALDEEGASS